MTSINAASNTVLVRGQYVEINSTLLFMRVTCVIKNDKEMAEYLKHELSWHPPALFHRRIIRKGTKSVLAQIFKGKATPLTTAPTGSDPNYVLDDGCMLQRVT